MCAANSPREDTFLSRQRGELDLCITLGVLPAPLVRSVESNGWGPSPSFFGGLK